MLGFSLGFLRFSRLLPCPDDFSLGSFSLNLFVCSSFFSFQKNGTHEGEFVFHTGEQNYLDYGKIDTWNGLR